MDVDFFDQCTRISTEFSVGASLTTFIFCLHTQLHHPQGKTTCVGVECLGSETPACVPFLCNSIQNNLLNNFPNSDDCAGQLVVAGGFTVQHVK